MTTKYSLRTPLSVGILAVTAAFGLAGCVPTGGGGGGEESPAAQTEQAQEETSEPTQAETEESTPSEEASEESSPSEEPSEDSSDDSSPSGDKTVSSGSEDGDSSPSGSEIDTTELEGEPIETVEGKGGDTVEVPEHDGPIVVVLENTSDSEYSYLYGTADHGEVLSGVDSGRTSVNFVDPYDPYDQTNTKSFEMEGESDETFTMSFYEVDAIPTAGPGDTITGDGFGVVHWDGDEDVTVKASHEGEGNFIVHGEDTEEGGGGTQYTFNEIGAGYGYLDIDTGEYYIVVEADGEWTFEPSSPEEADADSASPSA